jgi:HK97 family phage major capsid protein
MNMTLEEVQLRIREKAGEVDNLIKIEDAGGTLTAEQDSKLKSISAELDDLMAQGKELKAGRELRAKHLQRQAELSTPDQPGPADQLIAQGAKLMRQAAKSGGDLGQTVLDDPQFKAWLDSVAPNGNVTNGLRLHSPRVDVKALVTGASATSAGAFIYDDNTNIVDAGVSRRPLTIRSLITNGNTSGDTVTYVRQGTITNNAAPVAEATATSGGSGVKPESAFALSVVSETVKTIAHWIPATRRALSDAGQIRTLINSILMYGLAEELEDQIVNGDGTGENFTGISNVSGLTAQAYDTSLLITTRRARTKVMTTGRATPTGYLMHPLDWEDFDLLMDGENRYYFGGPQQIYTPRLWGLPVVESEAATEGVAYVADWKLAVLWDREQANILVSDSHSDFFIRNLVAILAEMRAAFGVLRPAAFVEIDLTA